MPFSPLPLSENPTSPMLPTSSILQHTPPTRRHGIRQTLWKCTSDPVASSVAGPPSIREEEKPRRGRLNSSMSAQERQIAPAAGPSRGSRRSISHCLSHFPVFPPRYRVLHPSPTKGQKSWPRYSVPKRPRFPALLPIHDDSRARDVRRDSKTAVNGPFCARLRGLRVTDWWRLTNVDAFPSFETNPSSEGSVPPPLPPPSVQECPHKSQNSPAQCMRGCDLSNRDDERGSEGEGEEAQTFFFPLLKGNSSQLTRYCGIIPACLTN